MNEQPKAGMNLDPEMLAAYIDKRLTPEQCAAVEERLAKDPDNYALLVESMKAMDALQAEERTLPFVPKAKASMKRWTIAAGVLAAAAAILLVVMQPEWLPRPRGERTDPQLEKLIASVERERPFEARLTGGFKHAPLRPVTRGNATDDNLALLAAAGELQRDAQDRPDAETQHAAAVALLLTGRMDQAIESLEQLDLKVANARIRSDLAAAYAARAQQQGKAEDWARSLEAAERAIVLDASLNEAWFNRALALEKMFLRSRAAEAWQDYLRHDPNSDWAGEAKTRTRPAPQAWDQFRKQLDQLPAGAMAPTELVASNPQMVREWIEETVLFAWATAVLDHNDQVAAARLQQAEANSAAVSVTQPTSKIREAIRAVRIAADRRRLAQAQLDFLEARRLYLQGAYANSADLYQRAFPVLASVNSPFAQTCQLYTALLPYFRGQLSQAAENLISLQTEFQTADPNVEGRRRWMLGIIAVGQGRYEPALTEYRAALKLFEAANESEGIAGINSVLSEVLRDLGDGEFWEHLRRSTELTPLVRIGRRDAIFTVGTQGVLAAGYPFLARHFQEEALRNAMAGGSPSMMVSAFQWMYAVLQRLGEHDAAAQTLLRAREWLDAIPDEGLRKRQEAELWSLQAESSMAKDPAGSGALAQTAIDQFGNEGRVRRLPQLYLQLSRARSRLNDGRGARDAIDLGLAAVEQQRVDVREARLRLSYFEEKWGLVEEGLSQRLTDSTVTPGQSLAFLERWHRPALIRGVADAIGDLDHGAPTLGADDAVIAYAMLPRQLVIWVVRASTIHRSIVNVERSRLENLIVSMKQQLASAQDAERPREGIQEVSALLLTPVADALDGVSHIAVAPDGLIGEVPFAALTWPRSQDQVLDRASVAMVPSTAAAVRARRVAAQPATKVLIGAVSRGSDDDLPDLPGAVTEANAVAAIYGPARADLHINEFGVDDFIRLAPSADVIHIAAHASANALLPHLSRIFLTPNAGRRSGVLTAAEISGLRLHARVAVLSACDTASGAPTRSEGVIGLASAFIAAGASSVVASLWPAGDDPSMAFQERFHRALEGGADVADALRQAQLWARAQKTGSVRPWSWATWILTQAQRST